MTRKSDPKKWSIAGAVVMAAALWGCGDPVTSGGQRSSGSVAMSNDSALVYAADTDNGILAVVDAKSKKLITTVRVGSRPARVAVGSDDTIYVTNRGSRSVSVIRKGEWSVAGELATDVDPVGLAVAADGKTVFVACATASDSSDYGTVAAFDTTSLERKWTLQLSDEPRSIALLKDGKAAVALYRAGDVVLVDVNKGQLLQNKTTLYSNLNASALSLQGSGTLASSAVTFHPRAMTDLVATPDGARVFATTELSREAPILTPPTPATPYYESQGPRLAGSVVTPAVVGFDVNGSVLSPKVDDVGGYGGYGYGSTGSNQADYPQTSFATSGGYTGNTETLVQGPTAAVIDQLGQWMYVVNRDSSNVMIVPVGTRQAHPLDANGSSPAYGGADYYEQSELPSVYTHDDIGAGADGVAVSGDNKAIWVYSQFDHTLERLELSGKQLAHTDRVQVATDTLSPTLALGRREFYDANDRRISARSAAISCSSCHLEGRDDAHVWEFPDGPRQTPALAGRGLLETQPYHWSGEFATLADFLNHTVSSRMGGTGIDQGSADAIDQFVAAMPAPENPNVHAQPTAAQQRGALVFQKAACGSCHSGQWLTNDAIVDVGTITPTDNGLVTTQGLNVPSLRGLARTAPYLHDGSAATLRERVMNNPGDKHGITSTLSSGEVDDLVEYLKTL